MWRRAIDDLTNGGNTQCCCRWISNSPAAVLAELPPVAHQWMRPLFRETSRK